MIKNKSKLLVQKDTKVSLLVDEINIKLYFDYKGSNIVGWSDKNNEAETSSFAFLPCRALLQYKYVAHVVPTKYFQA